MNIHPPAKELNPLPLELIQEEFDKTGFTSIDYRLECFIEGVRFAEKMSGLTPEN